MKLGVITVLFSNLSFDDMLDKVEEAGLDYVSCSPYRVPIARVAASQAAIARGED